MGNLVNELNVKQDRDGSQGPLVLGPGEGLSTYLLTPFIFMGLWCKRKESHILCASVGLSERLALEGSQFFGTALKGKISMPG